MKEKDKEFVEECFEVITSNALQASIIYNSVVKKFYIRGVLNKEALKDLQTIYRAIDQSIEELIKVEDTDPYNYIVVTNVSGEKQMIQCSGKDAALELADFFHGDDGKAYIFTNDLSVGGREEKVGGTIICTDEEDVEKKAKEMLKAK
jgi:hypothetical protein